jgi:hypothetical protein
LIQGTICAGKGKEILKEMPETRPTPVGDRRLNRKAMTGEQDRAAALHGWSDDFGND